MSVQHFFILFPLLTTLLLPFSLPLPLPMTQLLHVTVPILGWRSWFFLCRLSFIFLCGSCLWFVLVFVAVLLLLGWIIFFEVSGPFSFVVVFSSVLNDYLLLWCCCMIVLFRYWFLVFVIVGLVFFLSFAGKNPQGLMICIGFIYFLKLFWSFFPFIFGKKNKLDIIKNNYCFYCW